jgi:uncharacterized protein YqeY
MQISERLAADLKDAMRARDAKRTETIRNARAALQQARLEAARIRFEAESKAIETQHAGDQAAIDAAKAAINADAHAALSEAEEQAVLVKEIKRRRDSAEIYRQNGREELAAAEEAEITILSSYLPQQLSVDELRPLIGGIIAESGLSGAAALGKLMPLLLERLKGRAEGRLINQVARELLTS